MGVTIFPGLTNTTVTTVLGHPELLVFLGAQGFDVTAELLMNRFSSLKRHRCGMEQQSQLPSLSSVLWCITYL